MDKRADEKTIFEAFLMSAPQFVGEEIVEWVQPTDESEFPDVICMSASGRRIGVELGEWLNEAEMQAAKSMERLQDSMLDAVGRQGANTSENIYFVWLLPKQKARVKPTEAGEFRRQMFMCLQECDRRWPNERLWHSPQGHRVSGQDLAAYPGLAKYLSGIQLFPREAYKGRPPNGRKVKRQWPAGVNWITFPARSGTYSEDTMLQPFRQLLSDKLQHYGAAGTGFDHLCLVVYYNQAAIYNSPVETSEFTDTVATANEFFSGDSDPFDSVFLFVALDSWRIFKVC
jgi:hypothetical protein